MTVKAGLLKAWRGPYSRAPVLVYGARHLTPSLVAAAMGTTLLATMHSGAALQLVLSLEDRSARTETHHATHSRARVAY